MTSSTSIEMKVCDPSLASPFVEPYRQCNLGSVFESGEATFPDRTIQSIQAVVGKLSSLNLPEGSSTTPNAFSSPEYYVTLAGDGLVSICMSLFPEMDQSGHELTMYEHATEKLDHLGDVTIKGYYKNFGIIGRFGCCLHEPRMLCQLSADSDFVVLFGPLVFTRSCSLESDIPLLAIYQLSTAKCLFKKKCKNSFLKCDPIGIALCPLRNKQEQYCVAMVAERMKVFLFDTALSLKSSLQLESVSPCQFVLRSYSNPRENCVRFSPDGRWLSLFCCLSSDKKSVCLVLNAEPLEPVCLVDADGIDFNLLRWYMPIFSRCGTNIILSSYDFDNRCDFMNYKLLFYEIPLIIQSLKSMCRVAVLKRVPSSLLDQLPLSRNLISYLTVGDIQFQRKKTRKCLLM